MRFVIIYVYMGVDDVDVDKGAEDKSPDKFDGVLSRVYIAKAARSDWHAAESKRQQVVAQALYDKQTVSEEMQNPAPKSPEAQLGDEIVTRETNITELYRDSFDRYDKNLAGRAKRKLGSKVDTIKDGVGTGEERNEPVLVAEALAFTGQVLRDPDPDNPYAASAVDLLHKAPFLLRDSSITQAGYARLTTAVERDPLLKTGNNREFLELLRESGRLRPDEIKRLQEVDAMVKGSKFVTSLPGNGLTTSDLAGSIETLGAADFATAEKFLAGRELPLQSHYDAVLAVAELLGEEGRSMGNEELFVLGMVEEAARELPVVQSGEPGVQDMVANRRCLAEALQAIIPHGRTAFEHMRENPRDGFSIALNRYLEPGVTTHSYSIKTELDGIHNRVYAERRERERIDRDAEQAKQNNLTAQLAAEATPAATEPSEEPEPVVVEEIPAPGVAPEAESGTGGARGFLSRLIRGK